MIRPLLLLTCGALAGACVEHELVELDAAPGDLVILAVTSATGEALRVARYTAPGPAPTLFALPGERLAAFVLPRRQLVLEDGLPLGDEAMAALQIGLARDAGSAGGGAGGAGACGRCQHPLPRPPMILHPGDRCALPDFAEARGAQGVEATAEELASLRRQLVVAVPGACACAPHQQSRDELALSIAPLDPPEWPPERVAAGGGGVALFGEHQMVRLSPAGGPPSASGVLPGPVLAAAGMSDGRFVVATHVPGGQRDARLEVLDAELRPLAEPLDLSLRPTFLRYLPGADVIITGGVADLRVPRALSCRAEPGLIDCKAILLEPIPGLGEQLYDAAVLPDGALLLATQYGYVVFERVPVPSEITGAPRRLGEAEGSTSGELPTIAGPIRFRSMLPRTDLGGLDVGTLEPRLLGSAGGRFYACALVTRGHLLTGELDRTSVDPARPVPALRSLGGPPTSGCAGFSRVPGRPGETRLSFGGGTAWVANEAAQVVTEERPFVLPGTNTAAQLLESVPTGFTIALDRGEVLVRDDRAEGETFTSLWGEPGRDASPVVAVLESGGSFYAFQASGAVRIVRFEAGVPLLEARRLAGLPPGSVLTAVALDGARGGFLVVTSELDRAGRSTPRLHRAGTDLELSEVAGSGGPNLEDTVVFDAAEVAPDTFVLVAEDTRILRLRGDTLDEATIDWDDPGTPMVEAQPSFRDGCRGSTYRGARTDRDLLRAASAAGGIAWIVGCSGIILRAHLLGDVAIAERVSLLRTTQTQYAESDGEPPLAAVAAHCADDVAVAAKGASAPVREQGWVWRITPDPAARTAPVFETLALIDAPGNQLSHSSDDLDSGLARALLLSERRMVVFFEGSGSVPGSLHVVGARERHRFPGALRRAAEDAAGNIVAGTSEGRLITGVREAR